MHILSKEQAEAVSGGQASYGIQGNSFVASGTMNELEAIGEDLTFEILFWLAMNLEDNDALQMTFEKL